MGVSVPSNGREVASSCSKEDLDWILGITASPKGLSSPGTAAQGRDRLTIPGGI